VRLVLLGDPVAHSLSPAIQGAALAAAGVPGTYEARRVDEAGLEAAVEELRAGGIDGANVTMPHKRSAAQMCSRLDPDAGRAGAANTLVRVGDDAIGHNTDIAGIRAAWKRAGLPSQGRVLILGTGGAAAAALLALAEREVSLSGRRKGAAARLAERLGVAATEVPWGTGVAGATVVNATPIGMHAEVLPEAVLDGGKALFDMAYGADPTPAAERYRAKGHPVADGIDMLIGQAAESFRLWTGRVADTDAMRAAVAGRTRQIRGSAGPAT
jgi:shikimate dehydrogenase